MYNWLPRWYEIPTLVSVVAFILWARLQAMSNFIDGEQVYFACNDL
jgi:hypothetical protein